MTTVRPYDHARALADQLGHDGMALLAHFLTGYDPATFVRVADRYLRPYPAPEQMEAAHAEALAEHAAPRRRRMDTRPQAA